MFGGMERMAKDKEDEDYLTIVIGREEDDYIPPKATVGWIPVGTFILLLLISLIKKGIDGPSG